MCLKLKSYKKEKKSCLNTQIKDPSLEGGDRLLVLCVPEQE